MIRTEGSQDQPLDRQGTISRNTVVGLLVTLGLVTAAVLIATNSVLIFGASDLGEVIDPGDAAGYNILLVTLDSARWDYLGCYGRTEALTPAFDSLAQHGVRFEHAITSAPLTLPAHTTIMTGLNPPRHGVRDNGRYLVDQQHETLAETFKAHGYDTAAFVACYTLDERFGLDQGFDVYDFKVTRNGYRPHQPDLNERTANPVTEAALGWLYKRDERENKNPFFLWVHYFDAHAPYTPPTHSEPRFARLPYDAEIAHIDKEFGRLLAKLARLELADSTLIVLTADHGEALGEHGEPAHGLLLYDSTIRVPLIFSCPTLFGSAHHITDQLAGLVDLRRTLEDMAGLPHVAPSDGISLLQDPPDTMRAIYSETEAPANLAGWSPLRARRTLTTKYIAGPNPEYFDIARDPREEQNLFPQMTDADIQRFASFAEAQVNQLTVTDTLADPKQMMSVLQSLLSAQQLYANDQFAEAAKLAQAVLTQSPGSIQARRVLALSCQQLDQGEQAVTVLTEAMTENPDPLLMRSLAEVLILEQQFDRAHEVLDRYADTDSTDGRLHILRGDILLHKGRLADALACYEHAVQIDRNRVGIGIGERIAQTRRNLMRRR